MTLALRDGLLHQTGRRDRDYISFSAISTYRSCPLKYFFKYVAGLPEETVSASLVFGAAIHRAVEHHFRQLLAGNPPATLADLMADYRAEWKVREEATVRFAHDDRPGLDRLATRMLDAFLSSPVSQPAGRILAIEEELRGSVVAGLPDLLGRVDLICETAGELVVSDWKTSRSRWNEEQALNAAEQLWLYSELAREFSPGKRLRIEFAVLTKSKDVSIDCFSLPVIAAQVERTKRMVERVWQAIEAEHFYPAPAPMTWRLMSVSGALPTMVGLELNIAQNDDNGDLLWKRCL